MAEFETWRNVHAGQVWFQKLDRKGDMVAEIVQPGAPFKITTEDRVYNMELAATADLDIFKNGMCTPVRILDGTEDAADIASNPNLLSDSDMVGMLKAHHATFDKALNSITNKVTLNRLLEVATEQDSSVSKIGKINARIEELSPSGPAERTQSLIEGASSIGIEAPRGLGMP